MFDFNLTALIANVPALLIGFAFHEFAHAWTADKLGDPTPRSQGRLTLNPFVHLDLFGTIMALLFRFGWAKPVLTNPSYFKGDPIRGRMLVALAGPVANLLVAFLSTFILVLSTAFLSGSEWGITFTKVVAVIIIMNISLGIFNLLPIPPLDGFAVLGGLLPGRYVKYLWTIERYGFFILIIILFTNILDRVLWPLVNNVINLYYSIASKVLALFIG